MSRYGLKPSSQPCQLQLLLLPFGEEKADLEDYKVGQVDTPGPAPGLTHAHPTASYLMPDAPGLTHAHHLLNVQLELRWVNRNSIYPMSF